MKTLRLLSNPQLSNVIKNHLYLLLAAGVGSAIVGQGSAQVLTTLHSFTPVVNSTNSDGANPFAGLILSGNTLYGTAENGGSGTGGTVFKINTDGTGFTVIHSFAGYRQSDGLSPMGGLILSGNRLYGTTLNGGLGYPYVFGTVYAINTDGTGFSLLYPFPLSRTGGSQPMAGLIVSGNTLFGTTGGTVFSIQTDGTSFTTLHACTGSDGISPYARMTLSGNTLYGTSWSGGIWTNGTVFTINTDGSGYRVLHNFTATPYPVSTNSDGANPFCQLVVSGNTLYGTTVYGGPSAAGTVFALNTDGTGFRTLHGFTGTEGGAPAGLVLSGNTLYGEAEGGGTSGKGTLFFVNTDGTGFGTLCDFNDGIQPCGELVFANNTLYGTTKSGGSGGSGTVFSVRLIPQLSIVSSGQNVILVWPTNFTGLTLQTTTNLGSSAVWTTNLPVPVVVNGQNTITNPISGTQQFFRLSQ